MSQPTFSLHNCCIICFASIKLGVSIPSGSKTEETMLKIPLLVSERPFITGLKVKVLFSIFQISHTVLSDIKELKSRLTYFDDISVFGKFSSINVEFKVNLFNLKPQEFSTEITSGTSLTKSFSLDIDLRKSSI